MKITKNKPLPGMAGLAKALERYSAPVESGCIEWFGHKSTKGYSRPSWKGKQHQGHRLAYLAYVGEIPDSLHVLHRCDNPCCINPDHLFLGTNMENMLDKMAKGRMRIGSKRPNAKLTEEQVVGIRCDLRPGKVVARQYGICRSIVQDIWNGTRWKHVVPAKRISLLESEPNPTPALDTRAQLAMKGIAT